MSKITNLLSSIILAALAVPAAAAAQGTIGSSGVTSQPGEASAASQPAETPKTGDEKFQKPTAEQIQTARLKSDLWGEQTFQTINKNLHKLETDHFYIYSTWDRSSDAGLRDACEGMYGALCRQFGIKPSENIWVGKCPVYVFWEENDFRRFTTGVDEVNQPGIGGYMHSDGDGFIHVVLINRASKAVFLTTLVHEGTHAFLTRYRSNAPLPTWLQEGLAEYMAAEIVRAPAQQKRYIDATREALKRKVDVSYIFNKVPPTDFDYGIVQSLVRYMIARDSKAFVKMVDLIKKGESPEMALAEAYDLTQETLLQEWYRASAKALGVR